MKKILKFLKANIYLNEVKGSVFETYLHRLFDNQKEFLNLKNKFYAHCLIKYPPYWPEKLDIFEFVKIDTLQKLQQKQAFFIFDASTEGFSPFEQNWFKLLYSSCEKNNVHPSQIIFVSSNLLDESNIKTYCNEHQITPINVFSFPMFEYDFCNYNDSQNKLDYVINQTNIQYKEKYFSSLSRVTRQHRAIGTFLLCHSGVQDKVLISHNKINNTNILNPLIEKNIANKKLITRWVKQLPLTVDQQNFNINWASNYIPYENIHHQTLFQVVNETLVNNYNNESMFYSEKTFRPIKCFQPFIIFGQKGCNKFLENIGYKTYTDWFNLDFDNEDDYIERYIKLIDSVKHVCKKLDQMSNEEKINWKFKNADVLIHNYNTLKTSQYTVNKLDKFLKSLNFRTI